MWMDADAVDKANVGVKEQVNVIGQKTAGGAEQGGTVDTEQVLQVAPDNSQMMEMDTNAGVDSDSVSQNTDICSLEEVNDFLDVSFGSSVDVNDYFPDIINIIQTVSTLQKVVGKDRLDEKNVIG